MAGEGKADAAVVPIEDRVVLSHEDVAEDPQWPPRRRHVEGHESERAALPPAAAAAAARRGVQDVILGLEDETDALRERAGTAWMQNRCSTGAARVQRGKGL